MSILKTIYLQHLNGSNNNITLAADGDTLLSGNVGIGTTNTVQNGINGKGLLVASNSGPSMIAAASGDSGCSVGLYSGVSSSDNPSIIYQKTLRFGSTTGLGTGSGYTDRVTIDSSGRVTMPYQPLASVKYDGASKTSAWVIVYDNVLYNNGSHYNNTNGRFTCPIAGWYRVTANDMSSYTTDSPCFLQVLRNGSSVSGIGYGRTAAAAHSHASIDTIVLCAAGDYLQVYSGANQYGGGYNHATFQLIA
jgi:hypothetical protein